MSEQRQKPDRRLVSIWLLRAGLAMFVVGGGAAVIRWWAWSDRPGRMASDLRAEVPVGAGWDRLNAWLLRNGRTGWTDYPGRPPGVVVPPGGSIILVELPGSAGWDGYLRPLRPVAYVVCDGGCINDPGFKVHGHYIGSVPEQSEPSGLWKLWKRLGL